MAHTSLSCTGPKALSTRPSAPGPQLVTPCMGDILRFEPLQHGSLFEPLHLPDVLQALMSGGGGVARLSALGNSCTPVAFTVAAAAAAASALSSRFTPPPVRGEGLPETGTVLRPRVNARPSSSVSWLLPPSRHPLQGLSVSGPADLTCPAESALRHCLASPRFRR